MKNIRTRKILCIAFLLSIILFVTNLQAAPEPLLSYVVEQAGNAEIHCVDTNGNIIHRIPTDSPNMSSLSWSPDGRYVAYQSNHEGTPNIYVLDTHNRVSRRLTNHQGRSLRPAWSPDGEWIAYSVKKILAPPLPGVRIPINAFYSKCTIYIVNAKGNADQPRKIVSGLPLQPMPAWLSGTAFPVAPSTDKQTTLWGRRKQTRQ